jgi:Holliday junction resolvase RusA-like endonuclease
MSIPSKAYREFEENCLKVIIKKYRLNIDYPVNVKAIFYTESRRRIDLTNLLEALDDMLVKAEVIKDDCRDIVASHDGSRVYWDKSNPRIEVEITKVEGYERWSKKE